MKSFLQRLGRTYTTTYLANWMLSPKDPRQLRFATAAMLSIALYSYSPEFNKVVLPLLRLVGEGSPATAHCLALLDGVSRYEQAKLAFQDPAAIAVLRNYRATMETATWIREICLRVGIQRDGLMY
jgi:hypothetical protein